MIHYLKLMRLHQPPGIWLLLWPCWWSITLASRGAPSSELLLLFALGAILMRSAGCIINDIVDRKVDQQVERTRDRPLASGKISLREAFVIVALLVAAAGRVAWILGHAVVMWGALALVPVVLYPFTKRISWWPQLFLGFIFNWGVFMGWTAVRGAIGWPAILLYIGGIFWTLGYDTIYAHQDKLDDQRIGVKSTALRLGSHTKQAVGSFYVLSVVLWALAGWLGGCHILFFALLFLVMLQLAWQICKVDLDNPASCHRIFASNAWLGGLIWLAFIAGRCIVPM